jgi:hypothetical protein
LYHQTRTPGKTREPIKLMELIARIVWIVRIAQIGPVQLLQWTPISNG